jgi:hypothetical protein
VTLYPRRVRYAHADDASPRVVASGDRTEVANPRERETAAVETHADRRAIAIVFFVALALCAVVTKTHVVSWNDGSRIATVDALTANGTFRIDSSPYAVGLGDKIRFNGATYSDKPPLLALLAAAVALVVTPAGVSLRHTPGTAIYLVTLFTVGVSFALGCCYAYAFQRYLNLPRNVGVAVAALTGVGTLALPYAAVLTNHVPCGACALAGLYYTVRARDGTGWAAPVAGLFFALAYAFDASGILLALAGAIVLWGAPLPRWFLLAAGGIPVVALELFYNLRISGSVLPTAFNAAVWNDPTAPLNSFTTPAFQLFSAADYLRFAVMLLVGSKGLLSFTPLVLVMGYGLVVMARTPGFARRLAVAITATAIVYFVAILLLQNDAGARNFGERRYVDLFFVLSIALGPALTSIHSIAGAVLVRVAVVASVAIAALGTVAPFGGEPGESGLVFGVAEFGVLMHRTPVQAVIDVIALVVLIAVVVRLVPLSVEVREAARSVRTRA